MTITVHVRERADAEWRDVAVQPGQSLMRALKAGGIDMEAACEGSLVCGTCLVHIDAEGFERLPEAAADEKDLLGWLEDRRACSRLACQIRVSAELDELRLEVAN